MSNGKPSSFQLPSGQTVETVIVRLPNGRLVARTPDELVKRPSPPRPERVGSDGV
jgi:hypothetical protein